MSKLSVASQSKSVTWAMDRDWTEQMSKFVKSTNEAEVAGSLGVLSVFSVWAVVLTLFLILCSIRAWGAAFALS